MRIVATLIIAVWIVAPASAQKSDVKPATVEKKADAPKRLTSREIWERLRTEIPVVMFDEPLKTKDLLSYLTDKLVGNKTPLTFHFNESTLLRQPRARDENPMLKEVSLRFSSQRVRIVDVLQQAVSQISSDGESYGFIVRSGRVEILPAPMFAKEYLLNQTIQADFREVPLLEALEQLSEETGVTLTLDARAKLKAQTPVTARFNNDIALQDAVRMLTETAELKMVYMVTGIFITTPERARVMEKELNRVYQIAPPAMQFPMNPMPMMGMPPMIIDPPSPLAPPLPPAPPFGRKANGAV